MHQTLPLRPVIAVFALGFCFSKPAQAQLNRYVENGISGGAEVELEGLSRSEIFTTASPVTSSFLIGSYMPAPNTYEIAYSSSVGSGVSVDYTGSVEWRGATTSNTADLSFFTRSQDQVRFVSTGGTGPISATFELVYAFRTSRQFPVTSSNAEVFLSSSAWLRARNGGNGGPIFWQFDADRILQESFNDSSPFDSLNTQGSSIYTGTFSENQLVTFDLIGSSRYDVTAADAVGGVAAFLVLRDLTAGFTLETASGVNYSQIPEPAGVSVLTGLIALAGMVLRRPGRRVARV